MPYSIRKKFEKSLVKMESQDVLSTGIGTDIKFVQAIDELMGSLPEKVACRISNYNKDSSEVESPYLPKDKSCCEEEELPQCNNNDGLTHELATEPRRPLKVGENIREDPNVDVNGCVENILKKNLEFQHVSNNNGDLLIADALVELEGDFGEIHNILHQNENKSNIFDKPDMKVTSSRHVKFANFPNEHIGNGDCYIVPLQTSNENEDMKNRELKDVKMNTFNVLSEDQAQYSTMNFSSINEKPIKTHWALTRIACYKDAYTYEVMRPFKKAPKKLPHDTDKVFIVIKGKEK